MPAQQTAPYQKVVDPRTKLWVAKGLWPDCPDCQGLLKGEDGPWGPPLFTNDEDPEPDEIPFPCLTCEEKNQEADTSQPKHYWNKWPEVPCGTWPDCPDCQGRGGSRFESSWDGHRSEYGFAICQTCSNRTAQHRNNHPTDLDALLDQQKTELGPELDIYQQLTANLQTSRNRLVTLKQLHEQAIEPHLQELKNRQQATVHSTS